MYIFFSLCGRQFHLKRNVSPAKKHSNSSYAMFSTQSTGGLLRYRTMLDECVRKNPNTITNIIEGALAEVTKRVLCKKGFVNFEQSVGFLSQCSLDSKSRRVVTSH